MNQILYSLHIKQYVKKDLCIINIIISTTQVCFDGSGLEVDLYMPKMKRQVDTAL
jgi:hypothetical protein